MNVYKQIFISGRVQGVFFRESTRRMASELSLMGGVRNLRDGRVEVLVAGDEKSVESLIKWLKTGPKLAKVSTIEVIELSSDCLPHQQNSGFEIWATE
ncbi:MAG: acylphosphatase [Gammaproteobacteria bacterium]